MYNLKSVELFPRLMTDPLSFIHACEECYNRRMEELLPKITPEKRFIALAGPSCSGKTTTAHRLIDFFEQHNRRVLVLSVDDFFKNMDEAPRDEYGKPDLDHIDHVDIHLLRQVLSAVEQRKTAFIPTFNFKRRCREDVLKPIDTAQYDLYIIEGLHALHHTLYSLLNEEHMFGLYVTVAEPYYLDGNPFLNIRKIRFLRRMVRDYFQRNASLPYTNSLWGNVIKGEKRFVYPSMMQANWLLSSSYLSEPMFMRHDAIPLLKKVPPEEEMFPLAQALMEKLNRVPSLDPSLLPADSLLREFIGHL
ncbi:MAG TPA: hypothetical protein DER23_01660 [Clostridiales bacterium]|nr:hypothetical protein [Clostridiales bacterium]